MSSISLYCLFLSCACMCFFYYFFLLYLLSTKVINIVNVCLVETLNCMCKVGKFGYMTRFFSGSRVHFLFFTCILVCVLAFLYLLVYIYVHSCLSLIACFKIYCSPNLRLSLSFLFDLNSCFFSLLVCFITSRVLVFTSYYIGRYSNPI